MKIMKRVLITSRSFGEVDPRPMGLLRENGFELVKREQTGLLSEEDFIRLIPSYDALIIGADRLTPRVMDAARRLKLVCKHGTGLDNIDLDAAKAHQIKVTNVPAVNADAVADITMALMLDVSRKVSCAAAKVKSGHWERYIGKDICHKKLGIIGLGTIGQKVAQRAKGFDMHVNAYDPFISAAPENLDFVHLMPFDRLIEESEIITIHVPLTDATRGMISNEQMERMREEAILINTARGGIVDEDALYRHLVRGHLGGAGLDVTEKEPPVGSPLLTLDNVTIIPHIASYSKEALNRVSMICAQNIINLFAGNPLQYVCC